MKQKITGLYNKIKELAQLKGKPYTIAMGAAVGIFWNFIPSLGVGPFLSLGLARILKSSGIAAVTFNLATGFFIPFFYSLNLIMGRFVMRKGVTTEELTDTLQKSFQESIDAVEGVDSEPVSYFSLSKLQSFSTEFFVGGVINAILAATLVYFAFWSLLSYRRYYKHLFLKKKRKDKTVERQMPRLIGSGQVNGED